MDMLARPDLFKLKPRASGKSKMMLLTDEGHATDSIADLPSSEDALTIIKGEIPVTELTAIFSDIKSTTHM